MAYVEAVTHPLLDAVRPVTDAIGALTVGAEDVAETDIPLVWKGKVVGGVRLGPGTSDIGWYLSIVEREYGRPLDELDRTEKQAAVKVLHERGAFALRKSVEAVAEALGISRFTVYNYLNRED